MKRHMSIKKGQNIQPCHGGPASPFRSNDRMQYPVKAAFRGEAMKFPRRQFLHLATGAAALPAMSRIGCALDYPSRPVRFVVGFPAGSATDIVARLIAQSLSDRKS